MSSITLFTFALLEIFTTNMEEMFQINVWVMKLHCCPWVFLCNFSKMLDKGVFFLEFQNMVTLPLSDINVWTNNCNHHEFKSEKMLHMSFFRNGRQQNCHQKPVAGPVSVQRETRVESWFPHLRVPPQRHLPPSVFQQTFSIFSECKERPVHQLFWYLSHFFIMSLRCFLKLYHNFLRACADLCWGSASDEASPLFALMDKTLCSLSWLVLWWYYKTFLCVLFGINVLFESLIQAQVWLHLQQKGWLINLAGKFCYHPTKNSPGPLKMLLRSPTCPTLPYTTALRYVTDWVNIMVKLWKNALLSAFLGTEVWPKKCPVWSQNKW